MKEELMEKIKDCTEQMYLEWRRVCATSVEGFLSVAKEREVTSGVSVFDQARIRMNTLDGNSQHLDAILDTHKRLKKSPLLCTTKLYRRLEKEREAYMREYESTS